LPIYRVGGEIIIVVREFNNRTFLVFFSHLSLKYFEYDKRRMTNITTHWCPSTLVVLKKSYFSRTVGKNFNRISIDILIFDKNDRVQRKKERKTRASFFNLILIEKKRVVKSRTC